MTGHCAGTTKVAGNVMGMNAWREKPSDDSENRHRRCGRHMIAHKVQRQLVGYIY